MATSSVSNAPSSANFVMALGTGSGIDIQSLAKNLVEAERVPRAELIQKSIDKNQARITGYGVVQRAVTNLKDALDALAQPTAFASFSSSSSAPSAVTITGGAGASAGEHQIQVQQVARAQRSVSAKVNASDPALTAGSPAGSGAASIKITLGRAPATTDLTATAADTKPESIVQAINSKGWSVKASLVQVGDAANGEVRIVLSGGTGADQQFTAEILDSSNPPVPLMLFDTPVGQTAQDARLTVNGVPDIMRSTNRITGVIPGATINVAATTGGTAATVALQREAGGVKDLIKQVVSSYNDLQAIVNAARDPDSAVEQLGGSLVGDNTIRDVMQRVRSILLPATGSSAGRGIGNNPYVATGSSTLNGLRDLGVMIDTDGTMKFASIKEFDPTNPNTNQQLLKVGDESTLDRLLAGSFDEVAALFQGKDGKPGIARDMSDLISGNGRYMDTSFTPSSPAKLIVATQRNAQGYVRNDQDRLAALEDRMKVLLDRYLRQFAIMDSLVGQSKSERTGVENSFKAMSGNR